MPNVSKLENRNAQRARYYAKHRKQAKNSRVPWTRQEEQLVLDHSMPDVQLSVLLGRSVLAIQVRRRNLKE